MRTIVIIQRVALTFKISQKKRKEKTRALRCIVYCVMIALVEVERFFIEQLNAFDEN